MYIRPLNIEQGAGIETRCGLDGSGFEPQWGQAIYFSPHPSRTPLGPSQSPVKWVLDFLPRLKWPERGVGDKYPLPPTAPRLINEYEYSSIPSLSLHGMLLGDLHLYLYY
jgi:hypothetical protein